MTLPVPWRLGVIPRESSEPQEQETRHATIEARMEQAERRLRELEEKARSGFEERVLQWDYLEERLRELEEREQVIDELLANGPIPGERVVLTWNRDSMSAAGRLGRPFLSFPSRPIYVGIAHNDTGSQSLTAGLTVKDPVGTPVETNILVTDLDTAASNTDPRHIDELSVNSMYFDKAGDFDFTNLYGGSKRPQTVPTVLIPPMYYELEVKSITGGPINAVTGILILKSVGTVEQQALPA